MLFDITCNIKSTPKQTQRSLNNSFIFSLVIIMFSFIFYIFYIILLFYIIRYYFIDCFMIIINITIIIIRICIINNNLTFRYKRIFLNNLTNIYSRYNNTDFNISLTLLYKIFIFLTGTRMKT